MLPSAWSETAPESLPPLPMGPHAIYTPYLALTTEHMTMYTQESYTYFDHASDFVPFWIRAVAAARKGVVMRFDDFFVELSKNSWFSYGQRFEVAYKAETLQYEGEGPWGPLAVPLPKTDGYAGPPPVVEPEMAAQVVDGDRSTESNAILDKDAGSTFTRPSRTHTFSDTKRNKRKRQLVGKKVPTGGPQYTPHPPIHRHDQRDFVDEICQSADEQWKRKMRKFSRLPVDEKVKKIEEAIRYLHVTSTHV